MLHTKRSLSNPRSLTPAYSIIGRLELYYASETHLYVNVADNIGGRDREYLACLSLGAQRKVAKFRVKSAFL